MNVNLTQKKSKKNHEPEKKNIENAHFEINTDFILKC